MISNLCASWLIVLVLSPFTAPFSTCDLAGSLAGQRSPFAPQMVAAGTIDTNAALVRTRMVAGSPRLVAHGHINSARPVSSVNLALFTDAFSAVQWHEQLRTILRL
jgi:hypothetical protein